MQRIIVFAILAVFPLSFATAAIKLQSLSQAQTSGNGLVDGHYLRQDTGLITVSPGSSLQTQAGVSSNNSPYGGAGANASASLTTEFGEFHAVLHADAYSGIGQGYVGATAYTFGEWDDQVTISSLTLPQFTPVVITGTVVVDHTVSDGGPPSTWYVGVYTNGVSYYRSNTSPNPSNTATVTYHSYVGGTLNIYQTLNAYVATQTVINGQSDGIDLDIGHTVHFYLNAPANLDVALTSASGATYAPAIAAVPEPATLTMWAIGALGCAAAASRRRRLGT